jgi:hypothetical protein
MSFLAMALFLATPAAAQQAAVVPHEITVGDVFHVAIRVDLPAGATLSAPDTLALPPDLEMAGTREVRVDTAGGVRRATVLYPLAAWRPGSYSIATVTVQVVTDGAARAVAVTPPPFSVRSVLPADTAGLEPRPARDVMGGSRLWWPILLALLLAAAIATALYIWWRRRAPRAEPGVTPAVPAVLPRDAAMARLDELEAAGFIERDEMKPFYEELTETLRRYAAAVRPGWGTDLTTTELAARIGAVDADGAELLRVLGGADLVKFARGRAAREEARRDLAAARDWVLRTDPGGTAGNAGPADAPEGSVGRRVA